jgi:DNA-directed RNA polymerase specialized sigma24 family protein
MKKNKTPTAPKNKSSCSEEEKALISEAANGDSHSLNILIERHSGICIDKYKKYLNVPSISSFVSDEIIANKDYIIYSSAKTFNPDKGAKFSTWVANQTRFFCLNCINKYGKLIPTEDESIKALIEKRHRDSSESESSLNIKHEYIDIIKDTLNTLSNKKIKECIKRKYFSLDGESKTYTHIAGEMNVTVQTVINWHNKFAKLVRQKCETKK